jgi:hypothetical protein
LLSTDFADVSLSIVVVVVYTSAHLRNCLTALRQQVGASNDIEIIVVCHEGIVDISDLQKEFTNVHFYRVLGPQTQDALRSFGVERTRGKVVAITVEHCTPEEHWCARILEAHKNSYSAIGGAVEKGTQPDTLVNWAVHLYDYCNYGYYINPVLNGPAYDLSDCNASYKKDILLETIESRRKGFNVPLYNRALIARGDTLWLSPDIIVYQNRNIDFGRAAGIAYRRGRAFASARLAASMSNRRVLYILFSAFLPLVLLKRFIFNLLRKRRHLAISLLTLPLISLFMTLWSLGELLGYVTGQQGITQTVRDE